MSDSGNPTKPRPDKPPGSGKIAGPAVKPVKKDKPVKVKVKTSK
jgi:hypothetical protein